MVFGQVIRRHDNPLSPLQSAQHHVQRDAQPYSESPFVHFELRGVMWARRTVWGNAHAEITARALFQEQTHVVACHDDLAVLDDFTA
jgi:hypothetical protein